MQYLTGYEEKMAQDRVEEIAELLNQAGQAHHKFEQGELQGVYDQDWPRWYAGYLVEQGISALLGHAVAVDQLANFFIASYAGYEQVKDSESWPSYTARMMQEQL